MQKVKKSLVRILGAILLLALLGQCKKEEEELLPEATFSLTVNGVSKTGTPSGLLLIENVLGRERRKLLISVSTGAASFSFSVTNWDFQNPPTDGIKSKTYDNFYGDNNSASTECFQVSTAITICDEALVTYSEGGKFYLSSLYDGSSTGFIKVTKSNTKSQIVTGEFDVKVADTKGDELTLSGQFSNVYYNLN